MFFSCDRDWSSWSFVVGNVRGSDIVTGISCPFSKSVLSL